MKKLQTLIVFTISFLILSGVVLNFTKDNLKDDTYLPQKIIDNRTFNNWLISVNSRGINMSSSDFKKVDKSRIYNADAIDVNSALNDQILEEFENRKLLSSENRQFAEVSNKNQFIDYRNISKYGVRASSVYFEGIRDDKLISGRITSCYANTNCYFEKGFFINDNNIIVAEISTEKIDCAINQFCEYTIKLHYINLADNNIVIYESNPFEIMLNNVLVDQIEFSD